MTIFIVLIFILISIGYPNAQRTFSLVSLFGGEQRNFKAFAERKKSDILRFNCRNSFTVWWHHKRTRILLVKILCFDTLSRWYLQKTNLNSSASQLCHSQRQCKTHNSVRTLKCETMNGRWKKKALATYFRKWLQLRTYVFHSRFHMEAYSSATSDTKVT